MINKGTRLLAAVMFTDMVGYTALMQEDEERATRNRDRHRKVLQESITSHQGKILQYYGDGTLAIFNSAIEAVNCAIKIQVELSREPKIPLRIGIHSGDIVYNDEGVYGDSVNVASRIEGLAVEGSVLISDKMHDEVKNHHSFRTQDLGIFELKNVKRPIAVYAVANDGLILPSPKNLRGAKGKEIKSLAVLPFINMSSDPDNEYFSDGITEELLNVLAKVDGLRVTARTSSFAFKGKNEDVKQIGAQLGAKTILEGSVRKSGNRVRITAQLINTTDGYHIWSESYDRQLDDIFEVQEEIASKIVNRLREKLTLEEKKEPLVKAPTDNLEAYNAYLKGLYYGNIWTEENIDIARQEFEKAIHMESDFALPYAGLASIFIYMGASGKFLPHDVFPKAREYAARAIEFDSACAEAHVSLATVNMHYDWDWDNALMSLDRAIKLNPNLAMAYLLKAAFYSFYAEYDVSLKYMTRSIQLDPFNGPGIFAYSAILLFSGKVKEAAMQLDKLFDIHPNFPDALELRGYVYQSLGDFEKAEELFRMTEEMPGYEASAYASLGNLFLAKQQPKEAEKYLEKLLSAEKTLPNQPVSYYLAALYGDLGETDKMFENLEKSIEAKHTNLLYILSYASFTEYHEDPRFIELVKQIGLDSGRFR